MRLKSWRRSWEYEYVIQFNLYVLLDFIRFIGVAYTCGPFYSFMEEYNMNNEKEGRFVDVLKTDQIIIKDMETGDLYIAEDIVELLNNGLCQCHNRLIQKKEE